MVSGAPANAWTPADGCDTLNVVTVALPDEPLTRPDLPLKAKWRAWFIGLLLATLTGGVFAQTGRFEFVAFDDPSYVYENKYVLSGLTAESVRWAFSREAIPVSGNWHPLTWLSLMLDTELFGTDAGGFHLTNVVLHTVNVLLLFWLLTVTTGAPWKSGFAAALFAVHPLHVESVAWVSERKDVLSTFFGLIALLGYVQYSRHSSVAGYVASLIAFVLSLLSKQMLVTLPFLLLLLDYWPLCRTRWGAWASVSEESAAAEASHGDPEAARPSWGRLWAEKLPFFAITIIFCAVAFLSQDKSKAVVSLEELSGLARVCNAVVVTVLYLVKTVWPQNLACYYPHPDRIPPLQAVGALVLLAVLTVGIVWQCRRHPYLPVGWFWYLGTLVPVIGLVQIGGQRMADRYTYIPLIGVFVAVSWAVPPLFPAGRARRVVLPVLSLLVVLALASTARRQVSYWRDSITLFEHSLHVVESDSMRANLGAVFQEQGRFAEAMHQYRRAIEIEPMNVISRFNLGILLSEDGKQDEAAEQYRMVVNLDAEHFLAHINLGNLLCDQGRYVEAEAALRQALLLRPEEAIAHGNLGFALLGQGRFEEADASFARSAQLDPRFAVTEEFLSERHRQAGEKLAAQGAMDGALAQFRQALIRSPEDVAALYDLALALLTIEQWPEAQQRYTELLALRPDFAAGHHELGVVLLQQGKQEEAIAEFQEALRLNPDLAPARESLQRAMAE